MPGEKLHLPFQAPSDERIDKVCMYLMSHIVREDYDIEEALYDASVLTFVDDAMRAGIMAVPEYIPLNGLSVENGRFIFR